jgi:hypothetical protein
MPSDPKKPIEEMLEASARARRAEFGSDREMPNPMRARLHDEIARQQSAEPETRRSWLQMFWPRIAVAAAVATLLVLAPALWWQKSQTSSRGTMEVAAGGAAAANGLRDVEAGERRTSNAERRTPNSNEPEDILTKGPAATTAAVPEVNLADNARAKIEPAATPPTVSEPAGTSNSLAAAAPAAPAQMTKGFISKEELQSERVGGKIAATAPSKAGGVNESQRPASAAAVAGGASQRFAQQPAGQAFRNNVQANQRANVLNNFQVQQQGSDIRVVDADGSTYTGTIEAVGQSTDAMTAQLKRSYAARAETDSKIAAAPQSRFRASGYNVSLKKQLVFEGDYTAAPQQQRQDLVKDREVQQTQQPARITGTAQVHGQPPVEVDAIEVGPGAAERK